LTNRQVSHTPGIPRVSAELAAKARKLAELANQEGPISQVWNPDNVEPTDPKVSDSLAKKDLPNETVFPANNGNTLENVVSGNKQPSLHRDPSENSVPSVHTSSPTKSLQPIRANIKIATPPPAERIKPTNPLHSSRKATVMRNSRRKSEMEEKAIVISSDSSQASPKRPKKRAQSPI
jgi:hypothetical protein